MAIPYSCNACGGVLEFNPKAQALKCPNCGTQEEIELSLPKEAHPLLEYESLRNAEEIQDVQILSCNTCGANIEVDPNSAAATCPYCASSIVLEDKQISLIIPDGIRPFCIDKHQVQEIFLKWIKGHWFAPNSLKNLYQQGKIQGFYLPYWIFDADVRCHYEAEGGIDRKEEYEDSDGKIKTRTETDWYSVSGNLKNDFIDLPIIASKNVKEELAADLKKLNIEEAVGYDPRYLSGYGSEVFSVEMEDAYQQAKDRIWSTMEELVRKDVLRTYNKVRNIDMYLNYDNETYRHMLLPIYLTAYIFQGKPYQVLISGESGEISGSYPKSWIKIGAVSAGAAALLYALYTLMQ